MMTDEALAWWLISLSGVVCVAAVGMLLRRSVRPVLLWPALSVLAVLLLLPAPHPGSEGTYAPAFVIALFEGVFQASGQPTTALRLLLAGLLVAMVLSAGIAGLFSLRKRSGAEADPS